jgi:integrase
MLPHGGISMAIVIRCKASKNSYKIQLKECPLCGTSKREHRLYKVMIRQEGKWKTKTVDNLELARSVEKKWNGDIVRGEQVISRKKAVMSLSDFWTKHYLPWAKENKKSWNADASRYKLHIKEVLGDKPLDRISTFDIERLISGMKKKTSIRGKAFAPATLKEVIALLSLLFSLARKWGKYQGNNPCEFVTKPRVNNQITEYLTNEQHTNLIEVLETYKDRMAACIVKFAMLTGIRRGELLKLQWQDISPEHKTMLLKDPKGKKDQILPISKEAYEVLIETPKDTESEYIFYGKDGKKRTDFKQSWHEIREAAGLPSTFRFHGLRHNYASTLVSSGVDLFTVQQLLTHKSNTMTQRYAHLSPNALKNAADMAGKLLSEKHEKENQNSQAAA